MKTLSSEMNNILPNLEDKDFNVYNRLQALLKNDYRNYKWLEERINRKKTQKNPDLVKKLVTRQNNLSEIIDEREDALLELKGQKRS